MAGIDEIIGEWVRKAEQSGELRGGKYWGKPFDLSDGFSDTPARLRMAYRILKNAGYVPHEVAELNRLAELKERLAAASDPEEQRRLSREVAELTTRVRLFMSRLKPR